MHLSEEVQYRHVGQTGRGFSGCSTRCSEDIICRDLIGVGRFFLLCLFRGRSTVGLTHPPLGFHVFSVQRQMALARSFNKPERQLHCANSPN